MITIFILISAFCRLQCETGKIPAEYPNSCRPQIEFYTHQEKAIEDYQELGENKKKARLFEVRWWKYDEPNFSVKELYVIPANTYKVITSTVNIKAH